MEIKVRVYINSVPVASKDLPKYRIRSASIDRIVNDIVRRHSTGAVREPVIPDASGQ
ncbi:MAG: hypothetical protein IJX93_07570 [Clostridia bacterium]|nr:hypothetical protein [Clostridia bacterium]MBQ8333615.1 hypothetical protein [Clostridia bacterium]MBQ8370057.1 hypothetical protein [Clostridia bacterium]MBQ8513160.1 hypothetical protein [Clostridia bacterium]